MAPLNEIKKVLNEKEPSNSHGSQQVDEFIERLIDEPKKLDEEFNYKIMKKLKEIRKQIGSTKIIFCSGQKAEIIYLKMQRQEILKLLKAKGLGACELCDKILPKDNFLWYKQKDMWLCSNCLNEN